MSISQFQEPHASWNSPLSYFGQYISNKLKKKKKENANTKNVQLGII